MKKRLLAILVITAFISNSNAQLFTQDFQSSTTVSDYANSTLPNVVQFNSISPTVSGLTTSINSGQLRFVKTSNIAISVFRNFAYATPTTFAQLKFDFTVSSNDINKTNAINVFMGNGFSNTTNGPAATHASSYVSRIGISTGASQGEFRVGTIDAIPTASTSEVFSGKQTISFTVNKSGATRTYTAPDNTTESVANESMEVWVGTTKIIDDYPLINMQNITNPVPLEIKGFKIQATTTSGLGTFDFDNLSFTDLLANPQTKTWALAGNGNWNTANNWTPSGMPTTTSNVVFNNTVAPTVTLDFPTTTTINSIAVNGTANVTLATDANRTINLGGAGTSGSALSVNASRSLVLNATANNVGIQLQIPTNYTASINGSVNLDAFASGSTGQTNQLVAVDANSIQVNSGASINVYSDNTGSPFGTYSGTNNVVAFNSGARFVYYAGAHPFGSSSGVGISQFKPGSMYISFGGTLLNVEGRTYSTVLIGSGGVINSTNNSGITTTIDSLIVNTGTLNLSASTNASPSFSIGDISLGLTGTGTNALTLGSATTGSSTTTYNISGNIMVGNNSTAANSTLNLGQNSGTGSTATNIVFTGVGKTLDLGIVGTRTINQSDVLGASYSSNYFIAPNATITLNRDFTLATTNTSSSLTVQPLGALSIATGVNFTSNGKLKIESNNTGSGRIATNNGTITGDVVVERFIPGGRRAFRFLGHPFSNSIPLSQIMATNGANTGIDITGSGAGFTLSGTNNPSAFSYNPSIGNSSNSPDPGWAAFTSANSNSWNANQGIRVLVRGTKGEGLNGNTYTPSSTKISMSGTLNDGTNPAFNLTKGTNSEYNLIANPLTSTIDMQAVVRGGANVGNNYYVWDPNSGAAGAYFAEPFSTASTYRYIPTGSAFFAATTSTGTINFPETAKAPNTPATLLRGTSSYGNNSIHLEIRDHNGLKHDRILVFFDNNSSVNFDTNDGMKMTNPGVNFFTSSSDVKKLSINSRPFAINEIIPITLNINADNNFKIATADFNLDNNKDVFLHDKKTGNYVALDNGVEYSFSAQLADATTYGNRFELVMRSSTALSISFLNFTAVAKNNGIELNWNTANEVNMHSYELEESKDGRNFSKVSTVEAKNATSNTYNYFDASVFNGDNFYRIKAVEKNSSFKYSNIIKLNIGGKSEFSVYPNPVKGAVVNLLISNVEKGVYTVKIYNNAGQEMASKQVQHNGGSATQALQLENNIASGMYTMLITNGTTTVTKTVIIE